MNPTSRTGDHHSHGELRRRILRRALLPVLRAGDARLQPRVSAAGVQRILVCRPNHRLGNLLLLTPLLQELEQRVPAARVDVLAAGDAATELYAGFSNVNHVHCLSRRVVRHLPATLRIVLQLRHARYDWAIDPALVSQSGRLLAIAAGARHTLGFPRGGLTAWKARDPLGCMPQHAGQLPVYLLRQALGCDDEELRAPCPPLAIRLSAAERTRARETLVDLWRRHDGPAGQRAIGVFAEATGAKRYPAEWWQRFIAALRIRCPDCTLLEILPPDGRPRLALGLPTFFSPSPRKVAAILSQLTCFVSADCGVMHLASASGTPTLGLFSVSDVDQYRPYGAGNAPIVTTGQSPEDVATRASAHLESLARGASPRNADAPTR